MVAGICRRHLSSVTLTHAITLQGAARGGSVVLRPVTYCYACCKDCPVENTCIVVVLFLVVCNILRTVMSTVKYAWHGYVKCLKLCLSCK